MRLGILAIGVVFFYANVFTFPGRSIMDSGKPRRPCFVRSGERLSHPCSTDTSIGEGIFRFGDGDASDRGGKSFFAPAKVLADSDWNITTYKGRYASSEQLRLA